MNIILVLIDSLNRHHLRSYGPSPVATPNLDAFAARAWRFDNHFVASLPCMPARRDFFTGRTEFMWRPWGPLEPFDARLPKLLEGAGYRTAIVTDHYHYWEGPVNGYVQSFQSAEFIRGHEGDYWKTPIPADAPLPPWVQRIERWRPGAGRRYYANVENFADETDFFPAKVMTGAVHWLESYAHQAPFFLQVESFDVHEPFHVPEPYASMYGDGRDRDRFTVWPPYQNPETTAEFMEQATAEELEFIRSQYFGKLAMVDRWFGELVAVMDRLALWENTAVIVTTDHGHDLGERGTYGKQYPNFDSHANIPLFLWSPDQPGRGQAITALTSAVDLFATILDLTSVRHSGPTSSHSLLPLLGNRELRHREAVLYGTFGQGACCTDGEWTILKAPVAEDNLFFYSTFLYTLGPALVNGPLEVPVDTGTFIPGVALPQWKTPVRVRPRSGEDFLFSRREDPEQHENLWRSEPAQRSRMLDLLRELIEADEAPAEQFTRLGLA